MANTKKYLNHLLQSTGITPACSEEERAAAEVIARVFKNHGFEPEVQEFSAGSSPRLAGALLGIGVFVGSVLMGLGGVLGAIGLLLTVAAAVLYVLERLGRIQFPSLGAGGLSQNVIAYHKASGPLASPRNRPVVVVAHYDSPRADVMAKMPLATYRPVLVKLLPVVMVLPAVAALVRLLPLPAAAQIVLWILAILASLVAFANAVAIILNRFVLPYTSGAVCNKSSVAALLGVMDAVAPARSHGEFADDVPFDEYMKEQRSMFEVASFAPKQVSAEEGEGASASVHGASHRGVKPAAPVAAPLEVEPYAEEAPVLPAPQPEEFDRLSATSTMQIPADVLAQALESAPTDFSVTDTVALPAVPVADHAELAAEVESAAGDGSDVDAGALTEQCEDQAVAEKCASSNVNAAGCIRYGADVLRSLNMLSEGCVIEYEQTEEDAQVPSVSAPVDAPSPVQPPTRQDEQHSDGEEAFFGDFEGDTEEQATAEPIASGEFYDEPAGDEDEPVAGEYEQDGYEQDDAYGYEDAGFDDQEMLDDQDAFDPFTYVEPTEEEEELSFEDVGEEDIIPAIFEQLDDADGETDQEIDPSDDEGGSNEELSARDDAYDNEEEALDEEVVEAQHIDGADGVANDEGAVSGDSGATLEKTEVQPPLDVLLEQTEAQLPIDATQPRLALDDSRAAADGGAEHQAASNSEMSERDIALPEESSEGAVLEQREGGNNQSGVETGGETRPFDASPALGRTQAMPASAPAMDTVDVLMEQINRSIPRPKRPMTIPNVSPEATASVPRTIAQATAASRAANRSALFDLPDPALGASDPLADAGSVASPRPVSGSAAPRFTVVDTQTAPIMEPPAKSTSEESSAPAPAPAKKEAKPKRGLGRLFGRKKKDESSMSDWLGVEDDFDAKRSGRDIGSWDNFDDDGWKGGAAGAEGVSEEELREAVTSLGDDELLGHDIWFVATGSSENANAGMRAFLSTHRDKLRGVFLINLECVGSGRLAMVAAEGERRVLKGDKRIMGLVSRVSSDFHHEVGSVEMPGVDTDAHAAMEMSLRALTLAGVDGASYALSHSEEDLPMNVDVDNIALAADIVTEVIRRS